MPTRYHLKRGLPGNLEVLFRRGQIAHVVLISHRRDYSGDPIENVIICMSPRHEYISADGRDDSPDGEDGIPFEELWGDDLGEPDSAGEPGQEANCSGPEGFRDLRASVTTSYRKCKTTGDLCYLLITETRRTCLRLGGNASGLALCGS